MTVNVHHAHYGVKSKCTSLFVQLAHMSDELLPDEAKRLRLARERAGYKTAKDAVRRFGWSYFTYAQHENGTRGFGKVAGEYAKAFRISRSWLQFGQGEMESTIVPITGRVGADPSGTIIQAEGDDNFGFVRSPYGADPDTIAVEVVGQSMGTLADGAIVFYSVKHQHPLPDMLGYPVVVGMPDGQVLMKELLRGSEPGRWDLRSVNGPILADREVTWFAHIDYIVPPWRARMLRIETEDANL